VPRTHTAGARIPSRFSNAVSPLSAFDAVCLLVSLIGSAYLMAGSLGSMAHPAVGWFALVPVFVSIYVLRPALAGAAGLLWGVSVILLAYRFGWHPPLPLGEGWGEGVSYFTPLLLFAILPALYTGLGSWLTRRIGFSPFVLAVGWMGVELAFSATGFRFGQFTLDAGPSWLHVLANSLGYVFIAFLVAYLNAGFVCLISRVRLSLPRPRPITASGGVFGILAPRVFSFISNPTSLPCQPRAPPR